MQHLSVRDFCFALVTGLIAGLAAWLIPRQFGLDTVRGFSLAWLLLVIPILFVLGVRLGYFLGKWFAFFNSFGKFAAVGFANTAVDFGVLNILIIFSGVAMGGWFAVFKITSFIAANIHSYIWSKYWAFQAGASRGGTGEYLKFFGVSIISLLLNVAAASLVVNWIDPLFGLNVNAWANVGAAVGAAVSLLSNFVGFNSFVFKRRDPA